MVLLGGVAFNKTGGVVSFGPPVGIPICAHPLPITERKITKISGQIKLLWNYKFSFQKSKLKRFKWILILLLPKLKLNLLFFFNDIVQCNMNFIFFYKIAPCAILFSATNIKISGLYFIPNFG